MKKVLIICTSNSCRSQMAEGLVNKLLSDQWTAYSAGVKSLIVNRHAIAVMNEIGIDISNQKSKMISDIVNLSTMDMIVTVCDDAAEQCPNIHSNSIQVHLGFDDPAKYEDRPMEEALTYFREIRDDIRDRLISLLLRV